MRYNFHWTVFNSRLDIGADQIIRKTPNFKWHASHMIPDFIANQRATVANGL